LTAFEKTIRRVAIVGTGAIGASWTALYLARGFDVVATDPAPGAEADLRHYVDKAWPALKAIGLSPKGSPEHLSFSVDLATAVQDADFIQENGPENQQLKTRLFTEMGRAAPPDTIIASSTSGIKMSAIQSACQSPERCLIGHPFDPPHMIPLVEVVGGTRTASEALHAAVAFYASIGKKPILLQKEIAGHAATRLQAALYREVAYLIGEGVLSVRDADTAVSWGPGLRWGIMGPNILLYLANLTGGQGGVPEQLSSSLAALWKDLGQPELTPALRRSIDEGTLQAVGTGPVAQLVKQRDELLLGLLRLRAKYSRDA
jgi:3-hydroxyacyl-CoA dehydrogenase